MNHIRRHRHHQIILDPLNGGDILHRRHAHQGHLQGQLGQDHIQGQVHVLHTAIRDLDQGHEVVREADPEVDHEVEVDQEVDVVDHILPLVAVRIVREVVHTVRDHLMIQDRDRDHDHVIRDRDLDDITMNRRSFIYELVPLSHSSQTQSPLTVSKWISPFENW